MVRIFIRGELWEIKDEHYEEVVKGLRRFDFWDQLEMDICLAWMIKHGLIKVHTDDGTNISKDCLEGFENLMKIYGVTWEDIEKRIPAMLEKIRQVLDLFCEKRVLVKKRKDF